MPIGTLRRLNQLYGEFLLPSLYKCFLVLQGVVLTEPGVLFAPAPNQAGISWGLRGSLAQTAGNSIVIR